MRLAVILLGASMFQPVMAGDGILQLIADQEGWTLYVDGVKKAVTPDVDAPSIKIILPEGDHELVAIKEKNQWNDQVFKMNFFVGSNVMQPLYLKLRDAINRPKPSTVELNRQHMAAQGWVVHGDGTATNSKTQLTWKRCYEGQTLSGTICAGSPKGFTWGEAVKIKSTFAGKNDWRLPTVAELHSLVYCTEGRRPVQRDQKGQPAVVDIVHEADGGCLGFDFQVPTINLAVFPFASDQVISHQNVDSDSVWSSEAVATEPDFAHSLSFDNGREYRTTQQSTFVVRLVRGK